MELRGRRISEEYFEKRHGILKSKKGSKRIKEQSQ